MFGNIEVILKPLNDNQRLWLDSLMSGKYHQSKEALKSENSETGFCCLGVYCDVRGCAWSETFGDLPYNPVLNGVRYAQEDSELLSPRALAEIDITDSEQQQIAQMNDASDNFTPVIVFIKYIWRSKGYDI